MITLPLTRRTQRYIRTEWARILGRPDLQSDLGAEVRLRALYADYEAWARKAILNVAGSGKCSSDRTIAEYAADIWNVQPCPVPEKA